MGAVRPRNGANPAIQVELFSSDGDSVGGFESTVPNWHAGDTLIAAGNVRYRVTAVIPLERISEFADEPLNGVRQMPLACSRFSGRQMVMEGT